MSVYLFKITEIDMISSFDVKPTFFLFQYNSNKAASFGFLSVQPEKYIRTVRRPVARI